jgi:DNA helicase-2/ATP-dependent DNA helicase PcrA
LVLDPKERKRTKIPGEDSLMTDSSIVDRILDGPPKLSDDQRKAVLSRSRYNRIIAGAGEGKTETLTRRIAYLLLVEKVKRAR